MQAAAEPVRTPLLPAMRGKPTRTPAAERAGAGRLPMPILFPRDPLEPFSLERGGLGNRGSWHDGCTRHHINGLFSVPAPAAHPSGWAAGVFAFMEGTHYHRADVLARSLLSERAY